MGKNQAAAGEAQERFEALWREHAGAVLRYARRRVSASDAEDVLAETFVVAWRRVDEAPSYPLAWLLGIARRTAANTVRGQRRREALSERITAHTIPDQTEREVPHEIDEADQSVMAALAALRQGDRELLMLLAWDELEPSQAAQVLGCSNGALAVRLHRARRRFAAALAATTVDLRAAAPPSPRHVMSACAASKPLEADPR